MSGFFRVIANRLVRFFGNIIKMLSYPYHYFMPKQRFTIPVFSAAKVAFRSSGKVPKVIWQTNYSDRSALPVYINYLFNRLMSLDHDYRYVSTEEREVFMRNEAPSDVYQAYLKLNDGAAQADLWRVTCLYIKGGVYMDIDAVLVWPLSCTVKKEDEAVYIKFKKGFTEFTNYFLATAPGDQNYKNIIDRVVYNINHHDELAERGVYHTTGPSVFNLVLKDKQVKWFKRGHACIQGAFTNEYFQYIDKPRGKWTHISDDDVVK